MSKIDNQEEYFLNPEEQDQQSKDLKIGEYLDDVVPAQLPQSTYVKDSTSFQPKSPVQYIQYKFRPGSMKGSIFTLISATIGTGILVIPNSLSASGIYWGLIQFTFCGWLGYYSLMVVIDCAEKARAYTYQELTLKTYGPCAKYILNIVFFFANWGTVVAYLVLTVQLIATSLRILTDKGEKLPDSLRFLTDEDSKLLTLIITAIFVVPLSLPKELKSLRYFCLVSFAFVLYLVYVVITESFTYNPPLEKNWESVKGFIWNGASTTFPTGVFAYMCHPNVLDVFRELNNPTRRRMRKVIVRTIMIVFFTYTFVGSFGYIGFARNLDTLRNQANSIILIGYGYDPITQVDDNYTKPVSVCILLIAFSVTIAMPLCVKPAKDSMRDLLFPNADTGPDQDRWHIQIPLVLFTVISSMLTAMYVPQMQKVINLLGSSFFILICFIYPSAFYIKLFKGKKNLRMYLQYFMLIFNSLFAIWSTYDNIIN